VRGLLRVSRALVYLGQLMTVLVPMGATPPEQHSQTQFGVTKIIFKNE